VAIELRERPCRDWDLDLIISEPMDLILDWDLDKEDFGLGLATIWDLTTSLLIHNKNVNKFNLFSYIPLLFLLSLKQCSCIVH